MSQARAIFSRLLRTDPPTSAAIAAEIGAVLRRHEESRFYPWFESN